MALMGRGAAAIWHNVRPEVEDDYNHWHCHEHVLERVSIPGFLRGRRYVAIDGEPRFFHFYETETLATLTSRPYLDRLDHPTPWTRRIGPEIRDNNRTLAEVVASFGHGLGAAILTARLSTGEGRGERLRGWLVDEVLPGLVGRPGIVGAHLLLGDAEASEMGTEEKALREEADAIADRVLLVEAIEPRFLEALRLAELSEASLGAAGASACTIGLYRLHFTLASDELGAVDRARPAGGAGGLA